MGREFGLTFLAQLVPVATGFLLFRALGIQVSTLELLAIIPLIILAIRLPISFDGIGIQEGLYVGLFALVRSRALRGNTSQPGYESFAYFDSVAVGASLRLVRPTAGTPLT